MAAENDAFIHCKERAGVRKMKWAVIVSGSQHLQLLHVELISPEKKRSLLFIQNRNPKEKCTRNNMIALSSDKMEIKMKALCYMGIQADFVGDKFCFPCALTQSLNMNNTLLQ